MFITFEGIEGSGKTAQARRLAQALDRTGTRTHVTREPGGTILGIRIRDLLLHESVAISRLAELFLILADRAEHVEGVIRPALADGSLVICDRFLESTLAYQAWGRGLPRALVERLEADARENLTPDLTILLDCEVEVGLARSNRRRGEDSADRFESEGREFHEQVRKGFLELAANAPNRIRVINANRAPETIHEEIFAEVQQRREPAPS